MWGQWWRSREQFLDLLHFFHIAMKKWKLKEEWDWKNFTTFHVFFNESSVFFNTAQHNSIPFAEIKMRIRSDCINDDHIFEYEDTEIIGEKWIKCLEPGLEDYEVSSLGRIRGKNKIPRNLTDSVDGYQFANIKGKMYRVHRLIAISFHNDSYKEGLVVNHIDSNKRNNCPDNLEWVTQSENVLKSLNKGI